MSKQVKMNRGEWSEVYAFMKILSDGYLYAADADLNKIESVFFGSLPFSVG